MKLLKLSTRHSRLSDAGARGHKWKLAEALCFETRRERVLVNSVAANVHVVGPTRNFAKSSIPWRAPLPVGPME